MAILTIPDIPPSLNEFYSGKHWTVRNRVAKTWHWLVFVECKTQKIKPFTKPVQILFTFHKTKKQLDIDNWGAGVKLIIDGLRHAKIIPNDTPNFVQAITITSHKATENKTIVEIDEV